MAPSDSGETARFPEFSTAGRNLRAPSVVDFRLMGGLDQPGSAGRDRSPGDSAVEAMSGSSPSPESADERLYACLAGRIDQTETGGRGREEDTIPFDPAVAAEIDEYFDAVESLERFIGPLRSLVATYGREPPPSRVGEYELFEELGRGGSAVVYRARQRGLNRFVAVKLSRHLDSPDEADRMRFEAEAVAQLEHPGIVPIYEVGDFDGRPYFSMKLYEVGSLDARLQEFRERPADAADIVETVARAVQHAHQLGILHRDLKPSNILLGDDGRPHVADFGLAKRIAADVDVTCTGELIGTPVYIAPERIPGSPYSGPATIASDVYGLGAILYALLTGRPPFQADSSLAALLAVANDDVASPQSLNPGVDRDLGTICLKCLEKNPQQRYLSAVELAEDLRRWKSGEPILARQTTRGERLRRWCRRHPVRATVAASLAILTLVGIAGLSAGYVLVSRANTNAEQHRLVAEGQAAELQQQLYDSQVSLAYRHLERGELDALEAALAPFRSISDLQGFEWRWLNRRARSKPVEVARFTEHEHILYSGAVSPDGLTAATCGADATIRLWAPANGQLRRILETGSGLSPSGERFDEDCVDFSPDGQWLASSSEDGSVRLWSLPEGVQSQLLPAPPAETLSVEFSADSRWLVSASVDGVIRVWDVAARTLALAFSDHQAPPKWAVFSPDAAEIASVDQDGTVLVWSRETGDIRLRLSAGVRTYCVAWSPTGAYLATEGPHDSVILWDADSGSRITSVRAHWGIRSLDFAPDGTRLAATGNDGRVRIWSVPEGRLQRDFKAHPETAWSVRFAPDGQTLLTVSSDGSARVWNDARSAPLDERIAVTSPVNQLSFAPDGRTLAWTTGEGEVWIGDPLSPDSWESLPLTGRTLSPPRFSADGAELAFIGRAGEIQRWQMKERRFLPPLAPPSLPPGAYDWMLGATQLAYRDDGELIALTSGGILLRCASDQCTQISHEPQQIGHARLLAVLPDGQTLATCARASAAVELWDARSGQMIDRIVCDARIEASAVSQGGRWIACGYGDGTISVIDLSDPRRRRTLIGHRGSLSAVRFSPDDRTLASAGVDGTARLWSTATGAQLFTIETRRNQIADLRFSPDGRSLAIGGDEREDGSTLSIYQADLAP